MADLDVDEHPVDPEDPYTTYDTSHGPPPARRASARLGNAASMSKAWAMTKSQ